MERLTTLKISTLYSVIYSLIALLFGIITLVVYSGFSLRGPMIYELIQIFILPSIISTIISFQVVHPLFARSRNFINKIRFTCVLGIIISILLLPIFITLSEYSISNSIKVVSGVYGRLYTIPPITITLLLYLFISLPMATTFNNALKRDSAKNAAPLS